MKIMKKILLLAMTGLMVLQLAACSNKSGAQFEITMDEYNTVLEKYKTKYKDQVGEETWNSKLKDDEEFNNSLEELVVEQVILERVLMEEAIKANVAITDEELNTEFDTTKGSYETTEAFEEYLSKNNYTEETYKQDLKKQLIVNKYLKSKAEEIMKIEPSDKDLESLYNQYSSFFKEVQASHILVATEEEAKNIRTKLDNGEDFATLAKEFSSCSSAADGGNLGYFTSNQMVEEFSNAAFAMSVGEISDPVQSDFGFHIIKVTDIKDSFDKADKENVTYQYRALQYDELINDYINNANVKLPKELEEIRERSKNNM